MEIKIVKKGEKAVGPDSVVDKNGDGWANITVPADGLCFCLNASERNTSGFFLELDKLEKVLKKFYKEKKAKRKSDDSKK